MSSESNEANDEVTEISGDDDDETTNDDDSPDDEGIIQETTAEEEDNADGDPEADPLIEEEAAEAEEEEGDEEEKEEEEIEVSTGKGAKKRKVRRVKFNKMALKNPYKEGKKKLVGMDLQASRVRQQRRIERENKALHDSLFTFLNEQASATAGQDQPARPALRQDMADHGRWTEGRSGHVGGLVTGFRLHRRHRHGPDDPLGSGDAIDRRDARRDRRRSGARELLDLNTQHPRGLRPTDGRGPVPVSRLCGRLAR